MTISYENALILFVGFFPAVAIALYSSDRSDKTGTVTLQELLVTSLAQTDAVAKLLIQKKVFTHKEFMKQIEMERETYQKLFHQRNHK